MALLEEISAFAVRTAKQGSKAIRNTSKITARKLSNSNAQSEINKLYAKIGARYYKEHGLHPEASMEKLCDKVTDLYNLIAENNDAIDGIRIDGVIDEVVVDPEDVE